MATRLIQFGAFELDCELYQLRRDGSRLKLEKLPMDLLILLAAQNGRLVTRTEIVQRLWGRDVFVDSEHGVNTAIRKIRHALRDDPENPRFVETVHGRGYGFIASVLEVQESPESAHQTIAQVSAESTGVELPRLEAETEPGILDRPLDRGQDPKRNSSVWPWALAGLLVVALAALAIGANSFGWRPWFVVRAAPDSIQSLAVIPLENLSGDPSQEYFADGMTDELITMLAKNSSLRLISRTSAMQYKGVHRPLPEIARALGVDGILEGSISRSGDKVHMNIQLIQATSDTHVWAESYERSTKDLPSLSQEAALTIAAQVHSAAPKTAAQRYVSPEAHDAYLRGRYYWFAQDGEKSGEYLRKATELQPDYAAAWSGLSHAYILSAVNGNGPSSHFAPLAEQAVSRALALDDLLPDAYFAKAGIALLFHWDPEQSLKEFDRVLALDPQWGEAYFERSLALEALNRMDEAVNAAKRGAALDPLGRTFSVPQVLFRMRNYDAAIREARLRLEAQPTDPQVLWLLSEIYHCKGMDAEAAQEYEKAALSSDGEAEATAVHQAFERGGYQAILERQLNELKKQAARHYISPLEFADTYASLRRKDEALHFAELAYQEHAPRLIWLQNWPEWDFLHTDERYRSIVRRMGLPPAW